MDTERIGNMTRSELNALIEQVVERQMQFRRLYDAQGGRSVQEIMDEIDRHMWTPPPGAKSSLELLREDRDA